MTKLKNDDERLGNAGKCENLFSLQEANQLYKAEFKGVDCVHRLYFCH